jgi:ferrous iron transport protein B
MSINYIALVGPPNSGKTTFFNQITGKKSKVVNYPGSTVEICIAKSIFNENLIFLDTPGLYSLKPKSDDEKISVKTLENLNSLVGQSSKNPNLVISFVDVNQPSRHLLTTLQLIDKGFPVVVMLTMFSKSNKSKVKFNFEKLKSQLNVPVFKLDSSNSTFENIHHFFQDYSFTEYQLNSNITDSFKSYYSRIEVILNEISYTSVDDNRFDLDNVFLNPYLGPFFFILIMLLFFYSIFSLAAPFTNLIDFLFTQLNNSVPYIFSNTILAKFVSDGLINAIGSVVIFVPQIAFLFFGIGLMESSGYLARGAIIIDRPLSFIGLNGRCFVPLLSGFACAIPAMLSTRNIQQEKIKLICCFIIPLMQCSARLPVYGLLLTLLFPNSAFKSALALTLIYLISLILSAFVAIIVGRFIPGKTNKKFNLELPEWRYPNLLNIWYSMTRQTFSFIFNAGPIIFILSIILWIISFFPSPENSFIIMIGKFIEPVFLPMGLDWRVGVAILLSFAAREVFVSTLVVIFSISATSSNLLETLSFATFDGSNKLLFELPSIVSLIVFFMIALQCMSTLAISKKETNSIAFASIQFVFYTVFAYISSIIVFKTFNYFF